MIGKLVPWVLGGAAVMVVILIIQYNLTKRSQQTELEKAQAEAPAMAAQVGLIPSSYPYSQELTQYCYQAAQAGWTPYQCQGLFDYAQVNYPQFASLLSTYWPWYYENYYWPYYGSYSSSWWPYNTGVYWYGRRHGRHRHRRRGSRGGRSRGGRSRSGSRGRGGRRR